MYMLVKNGIIQYLQQGALKGLILSENRELLKGLARKNKASIAEIGSLPGETLGIHLEDSLRHGANCAFMIQSVDKKGRVTANVWRPGEEPR